MKKLRKVLASAFTVTLVFGGAGAAVAEAAIGIPVPPACGTELVTNGSFEIPALVNPAGWDVVPSGQNGIGWNAEWVDATVLPGKPAVANIELQNGRPAQNGSQFTELDSDFDGNPNPMPGDEASVRIYQDLLTTVGSTYKIVFYTSPVPGWGAAENVTKFSFGDGAALTLVDTITEDGTANAGNATVWTKHEYTLTASTAISRIQFTDGGTPNSFGAFLDAVSVKEVCGGGAGGGGGAPATFSISGKVWNDEDANAVFDPAELGLSGWKVYIDTDDDGNLDAGETVVATNNAGEYILSGLAAGSYTVREVVEAGWDQTSPTTAQQHKHVVTIATVNVADIHFGNNRPANGGGGGSSGGGGGAVLLPVSTPIPPVPTVAGDSITVPTLPSTQPVPQVLGASTELPRTGVSATLLLIALLLASAGAAVVVFQEEKKI